MKQSLIILLLSFITVSTFSQDYSKFKDVTNYSFTTSHLVVKKKFPPQETVNIYDGNFTVLKQGTNLQIIHVTSLTTKVAVLTRTITFKEYNSIGFIYQTSQGYIVIDTAKKSVDVHGIKLDSIYQGGH